MSSFLAIFESFKDQAPTTTGAVTVTAILGYGLHYLRTRRLMQSKDKQTDVDAFRAGFDRLLNVTDVLKDELASAQRDITKLQTEIGQERTTRIQLYTALLTVQAHTHGDTVTISPAMQTLITQALKDATDA